MSSKNMEKGTSTFHYFIVPIVFVIFFPLCVVPLALYPVNGWNWMAHFDLALFLGNTFTWSFIGLVLCWAVLFLKIPSKTFYGPETSSGYSPKYAANGFLFYCVSVVGWLILNLAFPTISMNILRNMPQLVGSCSLLGFVLCLYLWFMGKYRPICRRDNLDPNHNPIFEFYCGVELHPRIWDVNVKQLTNCRFGLLLWQILILAFLFASQQLNGFNCGLFVNVLLQSAYLAKFYWWETGYFTTLDIVLDRAGFYICFGCTGFLPTFYTFSTYYFVFDPPTVTWTSSAVILVLGAVFLYLNYDVDHQKEVFRQMDGKCNIWGSKAKYMTVEYKATNKSVKKSKLLLSGYWGISRHLNYAFELLAALFWNLPGLGLGPIPFLYNVYLVILLVHRIYRDENKCSKKYGPAWNKYCKQVSYRLLPYVF